MNIFSSFDLMYIHKQKLSRSSRGIIPAFVILLITLFVISCKTTRTSYDDSHTILLDTLHITAKADNPYRAAATFVHDLVHTKLEVRFDWEHQYLFGKAYVTIKPHFYPQTTFSLDAKNMDIYKVELVKEGGRRSALTFAYDSLNLNITLDREYKAGEPITIFVDYKAKPNEHRNGGSEAIQDDKGLYFINPLGTEPDKPKQIWTQGETESNSNWFPTFDKPNFKGTEEIFITVEKKYKTLSNGLLISQKDNMDGTRTDHWRSDLPFSPYLVMMAVGEFVVTRDTWRGKEVSYYMDSQHTHMAHRLFGETTKMMDFFSEKLGVDYPWQKYAQVVVRDYISGAMENTSATLHGENLNRTTRTILDEDYHDYVSHELFHQWFGDLVTSETWSNITLNESFADYSEYLWNEHRYGKDFADWKNRLAFEKYMGETRRGKNVNLVRYHYDDREEVFDAHSYEKGGRILHMLRNMIGDEAFFKSLQLYLKTNQYKAAEVAQLRLAFEEVTGRDLSWFFNQWYFNNGHPVLSFEYSYANDSAYVKVSQKHSTDTHLTYELPFKINLYYGTKAITHNVVLTKKKQTFAFKVDSKPDLIDADADRILLCEKSENKSLTDYVYQYRNCKGYQQRYEALDSLRKYQRTNYEAAMVYRDALHDPSENLRAVAARYVYINTADRDTVLPLIKALLADSATRVRSAVLEAMGRNKAKDYQSTIEKHLGDSSYLVASTALTMLNRLDTPKALEMAKIFEGETSFEIKSAVYGVYSSSGGASYDSFFVRKIHEDKGISKALLLYYYADFLCRMDAPMTNNGIDVMKETLIADKNKNKQLQNFGVGALEKIKDHFERENIFHQGLKNSDKSTKAKNKNLVKHPQTDVEQMIAHAKAALEEIRKAADSE